MSSLIAIALTGLMAAQPGPGPREGRQGPPKLDMTVFVQQLAEAVDATEEQVVQLQTIAEEHQAAVAEARARHEAVMAERGDEVRALRQEMREARRAGDNARFHELREQIREIMGAPEERLMPQTFEKIKEVLTEEQKADAVKFIKSQRFGRGFGKGPGRHEGRRGFGRRGPGLGGANIYRVINRIADEVGATEEQRGQLQTIAADHVKAMKEAEAELMITRQENRDKLRELHQNARVARRTGDQEALEAARAEMEEIMGKPVRNVLEDTYDKIAAIMTEEQMPQFEAVIADLKERVGNRFEDRGAHRGRGHRGHRGRSPGAGLRGGFGPGPGPDCPVGKATDTEGNDA